MKLKKGFAAVVVFTLIMSLFVMPVSAHGGCRRAAATVSHYSACTVDNCSLTGQHVHSGVNYCGTDCMNNANCSGYNSARNGSHHSSHH